MALTSGVRNKVSFESILILQPKPPELFDYVLLFGLAALWGSSFVFIKWSVAEIPAATQTAYRLFVAVIAIWIVAAFLKAPMPKTRRVWFLIALSGFFGVTLPFYLIAWGQKVVEPGLTAIFMAIMPLITLVLAHVLTDDEKFTTRKVWGVMLGLVGVAVLVGPSVLGSLGAESLHQMAILAAAGCYAVNAVITKLVIDVPKMTLAVLNLTFGFLPLIPAALYFDGPFTVDYGAWALMSVICLGLFHTAIAAFFFLAIISRQGATFFSQINLLVPLFGVFWAFLIFSERPAINAAIALILILSGIMVARGRVQAQQMEANNVS